MPPAARSFAAFALTAGAAAAVALAALAPGAGADTPTPSAPETPSPTPTPTASPTLAAPVIHSVEPAVVFEFISFFSVSGERLRSSDGSCLIEISGLRAYDTGCSNTLAGGVVPWNATSGDIFVIANGVRSNAIPIEVRPFEEGPGADLVPGFDFVRGEILVSMTPGADIAAVLEREGDSPDAARPLVGTDRYVVTVPEGEEVAKCRAYAKHPEVLEVWLHGVSGIDPLPTPSASPSPTPGMLPAAGAASPASSSVATLALIAFGTAAVLVATFIACRGASARRRE